MWTEWVGRQLGRYSIEAVIGHGAMGVVLRAQDLELLRTVAIKVLYPHLAADGELLDRFRLEARTAARLRHRNIVAIYDVGRERDSYYLVMEYLDGPALSTMIREQGPLPAARALDIAGQIAAALDCIHEQGLVHRDVKTANILLDQGVRAVLTDFGLVRATAKSKLTTPGTILGTPQYLAPEGIAGGEIGPWTDLYALGVVTYEMLTGQVPFELESTSALLFRVLWQSPPPVSGVHGLAEGVDEVLGRMLAKQPEDRYPSGSAFVTALGQALLGGSGKESPAGLPQPYQVARPGEAMTPPAVQLQHSRMARATPGQALNSWLWAVLGGALVFLAVGGLLLVGSLMFSQANSRGAVRPTLPAGAATPAAPRRTASPTGQAATAIPMQLLATTRATEGLVPLTSERPTRVPTKLPPATPTESPSTPTAVPTTLAPAPTELAATVTPVVSTPVPPTLEPTPTPVPPTPSPGPPTPTAFPPTPSPPSPTPTKTPPALVPTHTPPPPPVPTPTPPPLSLCLSGRWLILPACRRV